MLLLQNILYCLLFILMVKCLVRNDGMNCVYFYPKEYIEEADKRGLIDKDAVMKKGKQVMIPFCIILFVVLIAIIFVWNKVTDFKTAYLQSYLFLVVMNWFDGIPSIPLISHILLCPTHTRSSIIPSNQFITTRKR